MNDITTKDKTIVVSNIPLMKCIDGFQKWEWVNDKQKEFLLEYARKRHLLSDFSDEELFGLTAYSAAEVNAFLAEHGFDIVLQDHSHVLANEPPGSIVIYIASILKLVFEWDGIEITIKDKYQGTYLSKNLSFFVSSKHDQPIVQIKSGGDDIYITKAEPSLLSELDDLPLHVCDVFDRVEFPSIEYDKVIDVSWMVDMNSPHDMVRVLEAVQQDKFSMNHKGVKIESAAAVAILASGCATPFFKPVVLTIDEPFVFWARRNGETYFKAYFAQDSWVKIA